MSEYKLDCSHCSLGSLCMPVGLNPEEIELLSNMSIEQRNYKPHEVLFRAEQHFLNLYAIRSGSFKTTTTTPGGLERVVGFYLPGEWLGLHAIYKQRFAMTATALEMSSVCIIPYQHLLSVTQKIPSLQQYLFSLMSEKLNPDTRVDPNSTAESRIARLLLSLSQRYAKRGYSPKEFRLSMSREEIGHYLGLATETVSRIFTQLDQQGAIRIQRRDVSLLDFAQLEKLLG